MSDYQDQGSLDQPQQPQESQVKAERKVVDPPEPQVETTASPENAEPDVPVASEINAPYTTPGVVPPSGNE